MSSFLSVAIVTEAFRQMLEEAAKASGISAAKATALRPIVSLAGSLPSVGVNIFLYQITPNSAFRNLDAPTRRNDGSLLQPTRAAYDLHYLLTFYGNETGYDTQLILGSTLRALHSVPVLTRKRIKSVGLIGTNSSAFPNLKGSNLENEIETVKLTMTPFNLEELSKLWSVLLQTPYTLSLAFQASVVFIDGLEEVAPAPPVLDRNLYVNPFRQPVIEQVLSQAAGASDFLPNQPIRVGDMIALRGRGLRGDLTRVRLGSQEITPAEVGDTQIKFLLGVPPFAAQSLRAGVQGIQVVQPALMGSPPVEHSSIESNVTAFVIHPVIVVTDPASITERLVVGGITLCSGKLTLGFTPPVGLTQRVVLFLNPFNSPGGPSYRFELTVTPANPADAHATTIVAPIIDVATGDYLVRVQVDGAQSLLEPGPDLDNPTFIGPKVTIA